MAGTFCEVLAAYIRKEAFLATMAPQPLQHDRSKIRPMMGSRGTHMASWTVWDAVEMVRPKVMIPGIKPRAGPATDHAGS